MNDSKHDPSLDLRFHQIALVLVGLGVAIGIVASTIALVTRGQFATTTFVTSVMALAAAYPVFCDYRRMRRVGISR